MAFQLQLVESGGRLGAHLELAFFVIALVLFVAAAKQIADKKMPKWRELSAIGYILGVYVLLQTTNNLIAFPNAIFMKWLNALFLLAVAIVLYKINMKKR